MNQLFMQPLATAQLGLAFRVVIEFAQINLQFSLFSTVDQGVHLKRAIRYIVYCKIPMVSERFIENVEYLLNLIHRKATLRYNHVIGRAS